MPPRSKRSRSTALRDRTANGDPWLHAIRFGSEVHRFISPQEQDAGDRQHFRSRQYSRRMVVPAPARPLRSEGRRRRRRSKASQMAAEGLLNGLDVNDKELALTGNTATRMVRHRRLSIGGPALDVSRRPHGRDRTPGSTFWPTISTSRSHDHEVVVMAGRPCCSRPRRDYDVPVVECAFSGLIALSAVLRRYRRRTRRSKTSHQCRCRRSGPAGIVIESRQWHLQRPITGRRSWRPHRCEAGFRPPACGRTYCAKAKSAAADRRLHGSSRCNTTPVATTGLAANAR